MVVEAITGSGKTLGIDYFRINITVKIFFNFIVFLIAFVIPILEILLKSNHLKKHDIGALVISPTRELSLQIFSVIEIFLKKITTTLTAILFVGGNSVNEDFNRFETNGGNIVVATAGRLQDLFNRQTLKTNLKKNVKSLEILILDEADRLLDLGFRESIEDIFKYLPKQRRTGLFSATQTDEIDKLVRAGLRNPCIIQVKQKASLNSQKTPLELNNFYLVKYSLNFLLFSDIFQIFIKFET